MTVNLSTPEVDGKLSSATTLGVYRVDSSKSVLSIDSCKANWVDVLPACSYIG